MQVIGCVGARIFRTNNCHAGIAIQRPDLRKKVQMGEVLRNLARFFGVSTDLMKVLGKAFEPDHFNKFSKGDLIIWKRKMSDLSGDKI